MRLPIYWRNMLKLAKAKVWHKRLKPRVNEFSYKVFYLCFSLREIEALKDSLKLDKFGILSFYNKDHGARDGSSLKSWILDLLKPYEIEPDDIVLLSYPRVFGYVFNPVSFWYCLKNGELIAVLAEVNNTFGESHNYLVFHPDKRPIQPGDKLVAEKVFHVSPFVKVEGNYTFSFGINETHCFGCIGHSDAEGKLLETSVHCKLENLTRKSLTKELRNSPLMTLMVISLIHWQALKLFLKKVKYNIKPLQRDMKLTITKQMVAHEKK